jgi:sulfonate transport system ATP-binding protein
MLGVEWLHGEEILADFKGGLMLHGQKNVIGKLEVLIKEKWWRKTNGICEPALGEVQFKVGQGKSLAIMGPSGVGKTTLLRVIAGLDLLFTGSVQVDGERIEEPDGRVQIVFQDNRLFDWMTVRENVYFIWDAPSSSERRLADDWLERIGLGPRLDAYPRDLSEGQKKRVALARALARPPKVLLLDEPLAGLDVPTAENISADLKRIQADFGFASVVTTHDILETVSLCQSVLFLQGRPAIGRGPLHFGDVGQDSAKMAAALEMIKSHLVV